MGKQLKKTELTQEQQDNFRAALSFCASKLPEKNVKFIPSMKFIPSVFHSKIINNPYDFSSRLKSTNEEKMLMEFIKFVFNKYRVPRLLEKAWQIGSTQFQRGNWNQVPRIESLIKIGDDKASLLSRNDRILTQYGYNFAAWYVCVATGGSLYKEHCKEFLTKKEVHTFLTCPHDLELKQAVIFSIARGYGAEVGQCLRIAKSKISERVISSASGKFWREVVQFFSMNAPESVQEIDDLSDYFVNKYIEDNNYSILGQGFTIKSLQKKMKDWHYELRRMKIMGNAEWEGHPINDYELITKDNLGKDVVWHMVQIKSAKELSAEGTAQHHCVYSYKHGCVAGTTSIWSLRSVEKTGGLKRRLTVELRNDGYVVQARGFANRSPKPDESHVVHRWANHNGLYFSVYR